MSQFPKLKTGVVAQYPAVREFRFSTEVKKYLDHSEQRYRDFRAARRRWVIDLSKLDEAELAVLTAFFSEQQGRFGSFDFEDPWSGSLVSGCRFGQDSLPTLADGELDSSAQLTILEPAS